MRKKADKVGEQELQGHWATEFKWELAVIEPSLMSVGANTEWDVVKISM